MARLPDLTLTDLDGQDRILSTTRTTVLCVVDEQCPTCQMTVPIVEAAHAELAGAVDVFLIGQELAGSLALRERYALQTPVLDDTALRASFALDVETVPTVLLADPSGEVQTRFVGFDRAAWREMLDRLARDHGRQEPAIEWDALPISRPGCGSRSIEPGVAEQLAAEADGSPLRARRIEIPDQVDPFEFAFEQGLTDGLPVVPPTPERVVRMLAGTRRDAQSVVALVPPNMAPATVEKVAINAVMAGCRPEYLPVVIAAVEAVCNDRFNMHGVIATTHFVGPVLVVNGPIRDRIGMNYRENALGQGNRANATIGRALQLIVRNVGGGRPGEIDRAALGQPGKYTFCFAEHESRSRWAPLHVELGFREDQSTVTAFAGGAPTGFVDQVSRDARSLATSYGLMLASATHPKQYQYGEILVIVSPEHVDTFARDGWSKDDVRAQIQRASARPAGALVRDEHCAEGMSIAEARRIGLETLVPKFRSPESIKLIVAGGEAGKFAAYVMGWGGSTGSAMTTRAIEE